MSGGILGSIGPLMDRNQASKLSTDELLQIVAPKRSDRVRLVEELERRWLAHYCMPYFDTEN